MARRKSNAGLLLELITKLPWWMCLLLAPVAYVLLRWVAELEIATPASLDEMSNVVAQQFIFAFATIGQYIAPIFLLGASVLSLIQRRHRAKLADDFETSGDAKAMTWPQFEVLVYEMFRRQGYSVSETADGPDGGMDLVLRREQEFYLVQCKHWKMRQVGVKVVREIKGVIAARRANGGAVITSGTFSRDAVAFARQAGVDLFDGDALRELATHAPMADIHPDCPRCGSGMVRRQAKRGARAGKSFYGCAQFPECRGTVDVAG